jgi:hypothetical protein
MTSNTYAIRGEFTGINTPIWLRLYRHRDTAHMGYMSADGKTYTKPGAEADSAFNGPIAPPTCGTEGRYFWIRQQMPAEKTFPQGFEYVLMGVVAAPDKISFKTAADETGLGTPPPEKNIASAPGAAATAAFTPGPDGKFEAFVTIVTTMDGPDILALAKKRLPEAEAAGFDGLASENLRWWNQLAWHWMAAGKDNAKEQFRLPGMFITHGYLPPVKPDKYVHTTITLELCLGTMAQIIKPAWDEWDYGGNMDVLRQECYPLMCEMAIFYAAYARKGEDGYYHVIPSMEEERWGFYPKFARNKDVTSSLCMFRWALNKAADAAGLLEVDADLRGHWREVAAQIVPYAAWKTADGLEYAGQPGIEPVRLPGDHFGEPAMYPALLADEINLDSPPEQKDMMLRTVQTLRTAGVSGATLLLLGRPTEPASNRRRNDDAETLLNSRGGRIHLFPVVSPTEEVAFHNFQARGGFLVSAGKNANGIYFVEIQSRRNVECRLMNPWPGKPILIREAGTAAPTSFQWDKSNVACQTAAFHHRHGPDACVIRFLHIGHGVANFDHG